MDPNAPPVTPVNQTPSVDNNRKIYTRFLKFKEDNPVKFFAILFAILALGAVSVVNLARDNKNGGGESPQNQKSSKFIPISNHTLIYGFWEQNSSKINSFNLTSGETHELASLPFNIKKVTVVSPQELIFINETDVRDHGRQISSFNISSKQISTLIRAEGNYGIDDYVVSPGKRYIALWEVSIPEGQNLSSGASRVYTFDRQNGVQNLIYGESASSGSAMFHYPLAITDIGEVFTDTFEPNSGAGWAHGMSVSNLQGTQKQDIASMVSGTYSTQPVLSPDGRQLAFAGYDGIKGSGTTVSLGGFRQAILSPNTIELLDTSTKQRTKLPGLSNSDGYPSVSFDQDSGNIIFSMISRDLSKNGQYIYNLNSSTFSKLEADRANIDDYTFLTGLGLGKYLVAKSNNSPTAIGNLGDKYASLLENISVYDQEQRKVTTLDASRSFIQYIAVVPKNYFNDTNLTVTASNNQLQLQTFTLKLTLAPKREEQQSNPPPSSTGEQTQPTCADVNSHICNQILGTNFDKPGPDFRSIMDINIKDPSPSEKEFIDCNIKTAIGRFILSCPDSPLYLYGERGTNVSVRVNTQISNSNINYNGSYSGYLIGDGGINVAGQKYKSIAFDYISAIKKLPRLDYGKTVRADKVGDAILEYGTKLGLNKTEIYDLIDSIGKFNSSYVFVSFFDEEKSKAMLPISFNPKPDVYRNIVFYFRGLEVPVAVKPPTFEAFPARRGFTAIEISHIIDR